MLLPSIFYLITLLFASSILSSSLPYSRAVCQRLTPHNPLQGCPPHTLLVDPNSNSTTTSTSKPTFRTIQSAILSLDNHTPATILILPGTYSEQLNITRPGPLTLLGSTSHPNTASTNLVTVLWHNATGTASTGSYDNAYTSVLTVAPTLNASLTGSGPTGNLVPPDTPFGNEDFRAYNVDFQNEYLPYSAGPSLAVSVSYANAGFYFCQMGSWQDTVYIGKLGNAWMYKSVIAGQTDFLYGFGTLWIQHSTLLLRSCGGGITAWKGTNTTFENRYGVYIHSSSLHPANSTIAPTLNSAEKCALGRPWNALMTSLFAHSYLPAAILPAGYIDWSTTDPRVNANTTMAEYRNYGPGWRPQQRDQNVTVELSEEEFEGKFANPEMVFQFPPVKGRGGGKGGNVGWIDFEAEE